MNSTLKQLRNELDELKKQVVSLERGQLADVANSESDSNVFIVPKPNTDTGELRRRRYYLHEKISERFSPSELVGFMYSLGIDPGDVPGETHHEQCLQFVMYCERHGMMSELLAKLREERPRYEWKI